MSPVISLREWSPVWRRRALWGGLAALFLVASLLAFGQAGRARSRLVEETTASSDAVVHAVLGPELTPEDTLAPATGTRSAELTSVVGQQLLADGTLDAVTIWSPDGTVLFADDLQIVGEEVRSMRTTILGVIGDEARSEVVRGVLRTFVPLEIGGGAAVAVELDRSFDPIRAASDPWRLMGLGAGVAALLCALLTARAFSRSGRRAEGFDEDAFRSAVAAERRAERDRQAAEERREHLEGELERAREGMRRAQAEAREAAQAVADAPRLREHLSVAAEDLRRSEEEVAALKTRLARAESAVEAETARAREEVAGALAEIDRLERARAVVADRAAKAEEATARLTAQVAELRARPDVEAALAAARGEAEAAGKALEDERARAQQAERRAQGAEEEAEDLRARIRELERRPDLSAKLDAATAALDIARDQIRALTAHADESDAEASTLRGEADGRLTALSTELEETRAALGATRAELASALKSLRASESETEALHDEVQALRHEADAAGAMLASSRSELTQVVAQMKALTARAQDAEAAREQERLASAAVVDELRRDLTMTLEELERLPEELEGARAALEESRSQARFARAEAESALEALETANAELARAHEERDSLHIELARAREEAGSTEVRLQQVGEALQRTQAELASTVEELQRVSGTEAARAEEGERAAALRAEVDTLRADLAEARRHEVAEAEFAARRIAELEIEVSRIADLEMRLAEAEERAVRAERELTAPHRPAAPEPERSADVEARLHPIRFAEPAGTQDSLTVTMGPEGPAIEFEGPRKRVDGREPARNAGSVVEVGDLVRQVVREAWSDRGRMVSVYAEPVSIEAEAGQIEGILGAMLERSLERTTEGNRLVVHVEGANEGVLLSVEDGRPATEDAVSPEARRLAVLRGGWASVEAHPGGGAIFRVWLPREAPQAEAAAEARPA